MAVRWGLKTPKKRKKEKIAKRRKLSPSKKPKK
jgi:hypothetical protein